MVHLQEGQHLKTSSCMYIYIYISVFVCVSMGFPQLCKLYILGLGNSKECESLPRRGALGGCEVGAEYIMR